LGQGSGSNCDSQATCTNTQGSFLCSCNLGYFGSGSLCTRTLFFLSFSFLFSLFSIPMSTQNPVTAIPSLGKITSNSISISWNPSLGSTGYQVAIVDSDLNLVLFLTIFFFFFFFFFFFSMTISIFFFLKKKPSDSNTITWRNNIQFTFNFMESKFKCNWLSSCNC